jgi:REP element-mobilizing transposase RayT
MGKSFTTLRYHIIFATKSRRPWLREDANGRLRAFAGGVIRSLGGALLAAGGVEDHTHWLPSLPPSLSVSSAVERLKTQTSHWLRTTFPDMADFEWQNGFAAFTVSARSMASAERYIRRQAEHHKRVRFEKELLKMLRQANASADPELLREWGIDA